MQTSRLDTNPRTAAVMLHVFKFLYGGLFALSITLINPWGNDRGDIWVEPKVLVLVALVLFSLGFIFLAQLRNAGGRLPSLGRPGAVAGMLWLLFLAAGLLTAFLSPAPLHSALVAHVEMGDGWLYFAILAAFTLSNAYVLRLDPGLFRVQLVGMVVGGLIVAVTIFPQVVDWRIDYTDTSGQVSARYPNELLSSMWKSQMPMSFFTSRGHAGFVLAGAALLALVTLVRGWLGPRFAWPCYFVITLALWFTMTRGVFLALFAGLLYLVWRAWWRDKRLLVLTTLLLAVAVLVLVFRLPAWLAAHLSGPAYPWAGVILLALLAVLVWAFWRRAPHKLRLAALLLALSYATFWGSTYLLNVRTRHLPTLAGGVNSISSDRLDLWRTSLRGIAERPLFGWGFNGFGLAWPHVADWSKHANYLGNGVPVSEITSQTHSRFRYIGTDGKPHRGWVRTNKAHNIILDTLLSVGTIGFLFYLALFAYVFFVVATGRAWGLEVVAVVYLAFCLTWFESAQYSHLAWWSLSVGLGLWAARDLGGERPAAAKPE